MSHQEMSAVVMEGAGGSQVLRVLRVPRPEIGASDVLVRVRASALNRADILQRKGRYPAPAGAPSDIPGLEFAGEVTDVGAAVQLWRSGDRVMGLVGGGAHAEYITVHERTAIPIPEQLDFEEAAAIPEAFITAHDSLWSQAALRPGERVLIHAAGSGVGLAAIQLVRAMNAVAVGTARTPDKLERAKTYGLELGFVVNTEPAPADGKRWAADGAFDVVLDLVGGPYTNVSLHALAQRGRIMLVGTMGGAQIELDSGMVLGKRASLIGTVLRARPIEEKIAVTRRFAAEVLPLFASGVLRPVIDSKFDLRDIGRAHERMESDQSFGKIIVCIGN